MHPGPYCKIYSKEGSSHDPKDMYRTKMLPNQTPKQFYSIGTKKRAGPKKCNQCRTFEPAVKKAIKCEKYIQEQLNHPTDDIF